ncbi:MAG: hypothetical protein KGJ06_07080 [Pseudomonadota bacterium]|nr:hypothetical protein [Pseudomonadota bacterium]
MHLFTSDKKERKKAQLKKNRHHQELFNLLRLRRAEEKRVKSLEGLRKPRPSAKPSTEVNDKMAAIRNRLTGKKRLSKERWNRFATTGDAGGRGL